MSTNIKPKNKRPPWECAARKQGTPGGNDAADCDWPCCDCDAYANPDKFEQQIVQSLEHLRKKDVLTGCTSFVQRMLQIGYGHAAAIMKRLEDDEIISEPDNAGKRHWLT